MINVTRPFLPPEKEYLKLVREIWKRCLLTNNGPVLNDLELKLKDFLGLDHLLFTGNGFDRVADSNQRAGAHRRNNHNAVFLRRDDQQRCLGSLHAGILRY